MSDPGPCAPTSYYPLEPYITIADLCGLCRGLDLTAPVEAVEADPEADPPVEAVEAVPAGEDYAAWVTASLFASRKLYIATGYRFPGCRQVSWTPACFDPRPCCGTPMTDPCSCDQRDFIELPFGPIRDIISITEGVTEVTEYVAEGSRLYRTDGLKWVTDGSLTIVYRYGLDIPPEAKPLLAAYTCELVKSCKPNSNCELRKGYREYKNGGATYTMPDPQDYRADLLVGYDPLDDWIMLIRGGHARTRPRLAGRRLRGVRGAIT